jgi:hypothetical protein
VSCKYRELSDDRSRLSGHGASPNRSCSTSGFGKNHQSGFLAIGDALQTKTAGAGMARAALFGGTEDADLLKR